MSGKLGPYPLHVASRQLTLAVVQFTTANGADPSVYSDPGGVTASIARTAEGQITVTLKDKYNYIYPQLNWVSDTDAYSVLLYGMVTGQSAANTVILESYLTKGGTNDDLPGTVITLTLLLGN